MDEHNEYKIGNLIKGKVTGIEKYGVFVNVENKYNGLIHISEISEDYVKDINDYVKIDEVIYCQILDINEENAQLKLSIKNINYKVNNENDKIKETRKGFLPLKENLDRWINEKIDEYKK